MNIFLVYFGHFPSEQPILYRFHGVCFGRFWPDLGTNTSSSWRGGLMGNSSKLIPASAA